MLREMDSRYGIGSISLDGLLLEKEPASPKAVHLEVLQIADFMQMKRPFPCHERLREEGLLKQRESSICCVFVSHQRLVFLVVA